MSEPGENLPKEKQTVLGLYVTAKDAYARWLAAPDAVKILDVRTPEEYLFVGHPTMAWKIPVAVQTYEWDATRGQYPMTVMTDFVDRVRKVAKQDDTLMVMCRSGGRSAIAVNLLAKAGFNWVTRDVGDTPRFRLLGITLAGMSYDHVLARGLEAHLPGDLAEVQ